MTEPTAALNPFSYLASLPFDRRLALYDVQGSVAWARALHRAAVLTTAEKEKIVRGLASIREELENGTFPFRPELEDIHYNVEAHLTEKIGPLGGKLHTGRSRNDQVATDLRLYVKDAVRQTVARLKDYQRALVGQAKQHPDTVMPGYTHLQRAQPVLLAHHFLAYVEMAQRDAERFRDAYQRADVLPLGSAALAGTAYPIDREALAKDLGFSRVSRNSLDAVADRDFVVEFEAAAALTMAHLSRLAEEIVLWSSEEFGFLRVADDYSSGSSIMPQKRNPDIAELARGKTGRVYGHLLAMLTTLKALPLSYNRDLQEDKEGLFDTVDTLLSTLEVTAGMVRTLTVDRQRLQAAASSGFLLATELADYLARKGVPFREAHGAVQRLVQTAIERGKDLRDLTLKEYRAASPAFDADVKRITAESAIAARDVAGGTARRRVEQALAEASRLVEEAVL